MQVLFSSVNEVNNKKITLSQGGRLWQQSVVYTNHFCMLRREAFGPPYPPCQAVTQARIALPYRSLSPHLGAGACCVGISISAACLDPTNHIGEQALSVDNSSQPDVCPGQINSAYSPQQLEESEDNKLFITCAISLQN